MNRTLKNSLVLTASFIAGGLNATPEEQEPMSREKIHKRKIEDIDKKLSEKEAQIPLAQRLADLPHNWKKQVYICPLCTEEKHHSPCAYEFLARSYPWRWERMKRIAYLQKSSPYDILRSVFVIGAIQMALLPLEPSEEVVPDRLPNNIVSGPHTVIESDDEDDVVEDVVSEVESKEREG